MVHGASTLYLNFPPLCMLAKPEKSRSHSCIRLAINQPEHAEHKLVGAVVATGGGSLAQHAQLSPTAKANRSVA